MEACEKPIYLIALGGEWIGTAQCMKMHALPCYGDMKSAKEAIAHLADQFRRPAAAFRIVEYKFSGNVIEG